MASSSSHVRQESSSTTSTATQSLHQAGSTSPRRTAVMIPSSPSSSNVARPAYNSRRSKARIPALLALDSTGSDGARRTGAGAEVVIEMEEEPSASNSLLFEAPREEERKEPLAKRRSGETGRSAAEEEDESTLEHLTYDVPSLGTAGYGGSNRSPDTRLNSAAWSIPLSSANHDLRDEDFAHQSHDQHQHSKLDFEPITRREKAWMWSSAFILLVLFAVAISISKDWIDWPGDGIGKL